MSYLSTCNRIILASLSSLVVGSVAEAQFTAKLLDPSGNYSHSYAFCASGDTSAGSGWGFVTGYNEHALLWNGTSGSVVDLHPSGFTESYAYGAFGGKQVGGGRPSGTNRPDHALLWSGTAASRVDLNPAGADGSVALAVAGSKQVGWGQITAFAAHHALLWSGTAASCVDLNPAGIDWSVACGTDVAKQVGYGWGPSTDFWEHALLWSGASAGCVDLHPSDFTRSYAYAVSEGTQVGEGYGAPTNGYYHALLWKGDPSNYVDLNPPGFTSSGALGVLSGIQVGAGYGPSTGDHYHALLWTGTSGSYVDLHPSLAALPVQLVSSYAEGVSENGDIVGYGVDANGFHYALRWSRTNTYHIRDLGTLGGPTSRAYAVNDSGVVVGESSVGDLNHAFRWNKGLMIDVGVLPGGTHSRARGISNSGVVVGDGDYGNGGHERGFYWQGGVLSVLSQQGSGADSSAFTVHDILGSWRAGGYVLNGGEFAATWSTAANATYPELGHPNSWINGIDDAGDMVGGADSWSTGQRDYLRRTNGDTYTFEFSGASSETIAISPNGRWIAVVVSFEDGSRRIEILDSGTLAIHQSFTSPRTTVLRAINSAAVAVGVEFQGADNFAIKMDGVWPEIKLDSILDASSKGWHLKEASGINARGQIVGVGVINGQEHAYLATPVGVSYYLAPFTSTLP